MWELKYTYNGYTIDLLKPVLLYVNGKWLKTKPIMFYKGHLLLENVDDKLPNLKTETIDLKWHFTVAEGKQIKSYKGKLSFWDKVSFILRSKSLF